MLQIPLFLSGSFLFWLWRGDLLRIMWMTQCVYLFSNLFCSLSALCKVPLAGSDAACWIAWVCEKWRFICTSVRRTGFLPTTCVLSLYLVKTAPAAEMFTSSQVLFEQMHVKIFILESDFGSNVLQTFWAVLFVPPPAWLYNLNCHGTFISCQAPAQNLLLLTFHTLNLMNGQ